VRPVMFDNLGPLAHRPSLRRGRERDPRRPLLYARGTRAGLEAARP
jgi:hypothetical protein